MTKSSWIANDLKATENQQLEKLSEIVLKSIEEEKLISEKLYQFEDKNPPFTSRLTDKVAVFGGSWRFVLAFSFVLVLWISMNVFWLTRPFDAYPFILLNLLLSTILPCRRPLL